MNNAGPPTRYSVLHDLHKTLGTIKPVEQGNTKSSAQVETSVLPPKSCALKRGSTNKRPRTTPFAVRVTEQQKAIIKAKAKAANCNVNEYIRLAVLGLNYASSIDPERRRLLLDINRELSRQGNNLNQIAKHLNAGLGPEAHGLSVIEELTHSLMEAQMAVRQALAEGRTEE